jgi:hypothetical protein
MVHVINSPVIEASSGHGGVPDLAGLVVNVLLIGIAVPEELVQDGNVVEALDFHSIECGEVLTPDGIGEYSWGVMWAH